MRTNHPISFERLRIITSLILLTSLWTDSANALLPKECDDYTVTQGDPRADRIIFMNTRGSMNAQDGACAALYASDSETKTC
jgi:hypothetical protein